MKNLTFEKIKQYLNSHEANSKNLYNIEEVFKIFALCEVKSFEDFSKFHEFGLFMKNQMSGLSHFSGSGAEPYEFEVLTEAFYDKLMSFISGVFANRQREYSRVVSTIMPSGKNTRILDLGAGEFPLSSFMIAQNADDVTTQDKEFMFYDETISGLGCKPKQEIFTKDTDLSNYDFVVGNKPCEATLDMIANCAKNNLPYFIDICNCAIPSLVSLSRVSDDVWQNIMRELDPRIQFVVDYGARCVDRYAFVLDATPDQIYGVINAIERMNNSDVIESVLDRFLKVIGKGNNFEM